MRKQHILFDLDDTLIHCNRYFVSAREQFLNEMVRIFADYPLDRQFVEQTQQEIDLKGIEQYGLAKKGFPDSLVSTYHVVCEKFGREKVKEEEEIFLSIGLQVYNQPIELYPFAMETLKGLKEMGHELYLYTGGDEDVQNEKVIKAGLASMFPKHKRFISPHKNTEILKGILREQLLNPINTWMIGNSARNDIRPALEAGLHAIYIPDPYGWFYDRVEIDLQPQGKFHVLSSLENVVSLIEQHVEQERGEDFLGWTRVDMVY